MLAEITITNLPFHKHLHLNYSINIFASTASHWQLAIFILKRNVYMQVQLVIGFFSSLRFYFSASHANSSIVGTSDKGQLSTLQLYSKEIFKIPLIYQEMLDILQMIKFLHISKHCFITHEYHLGQKALCHSLMTLETYKRHVETKTSISLCYKYNLLTL